MTAWGAARSNKGERMTPGGAVWDPNLQKARTDSERNQSQVSYLLALILDV